MSNSAFLWRWFNLSNSTVTQHLSLIHNCRCDQKFLGNLDTTPCMRYFRRTKSKHRFAWPLTFCCVTRHINAMFRCLVFIESLIGNAITLENFRYALKNFCETLTPAICTVSQYLIYAEWLTGNASLLGINLHIKIDTSYASL